APDGDRGARPFVERVGPRPERSVQRGLDAGLRLRDAVFGPRAGEAALGRWAAHDLPLPSQRTERGHGRRRTRQVRSQRWLGRCRLPAHVMVRRFLDAVATAWAIAALAAIGIVAAGFALVLLPVV